MSQRIQTRAAEPFTNAATAPKPQGKVVLQAPTPPDVRTTVKVDLAGRESQCLSRLDLVITTFKVLKVDGGVERLHLQSDVPPGSGVGSSSALTHKVAKKLGRIGSKVTTVSFDFLALHSWEVTHE